MGRRVSWAQRKRRRQSQSSIAERESPDAPLAESGCQRGGQDQREYLELVYRRLVVRLGHAQAIGAIAHRLCRLVWKILHDGVAYEERGPAVTNARAQRRAAKLIRELRSLGYRVERMPSPASTLA
jgi:hypothetical protein